VINQPVCSANSNLTLIIKVYNTAINLTQVGWLYRDIVVGCYVCATSNGCTNEDDDLLDSIAIVTSNPAKQYTYY
jgi:hypothetical protein